jgi:hypothetical protein
MRPANPTMTKRQARHLDGRLDGSPKLKAAMATEDYDSIFGVELAPHVRTTFDGFIVCNLSVILTTVQQKWFPLNLPFSHLYAPDTSIISFEFGATFLQNVVP